MSNLFINPDGQYPRHMGDILIEHPDFNGTDLPAGWSLVQEVERPTVGEDEIVYEVSPVLVDGVYNQSWAVRPVTEEEIERRNNHPKDWEEVKKLLPFQF